MVSGKQNSAAGRIRVFFGAGVIAATACAADDNNPAETNRTNANVIIENQFATSVPVGLVKVSYAGKLFDRAILANGQKSEAQAVPSGAARAYALAAFGWNPTMGTPADLVIIQTKDPVEAAAGATLPVVFSLPSHVGKCGGTPPLSQAEYETIAKTYFPDDKVQSYDAIKCGP